MNYELLHPKVRAALEARAMIARVVPCNPELADTAAFCAHYGFSPAQSANTIIVASRSEPVQYVACLVLATTKLDVNKKVRQLMQVRKVSFATAEQTATLTGMLIGGVTVVGLPATIPIYIDSAVMEQPEIILGGGNRSSKLLLKSSELGKLPNTQVIEGLGLLRD